MVVDVHGCRLFVDDSGGSGTPVVMLHGFLFDGRMFDAQVAALASDHRCIRVDFRGQGRSAPTTSGLQVEQQAADIRAVLRILEVPRAHLVGLSMGGYVAMRLAAREPALAASVTLLNTGAGPHPRRKVPEHLALAALARLVGTSAGPVVDGLEASMFGPAFRADPASEPVRATWRQRWASADVPSLVATLLAIMRRPDVLAELSDITAPTLVVAGRDDHQHPPADTEAVHAEVAGSRSVVLDEVGHSATVEAPEAVSALLRDHIGAAADR